MPTWSLRKRPALADAAAPSAKHRATTSNAARAATPSVARVATPSVARAATPSVARAATPSLPRASTPILPSVIIPSALELHLSTWGVRLRQAMENAVAPRNTLRALMSANIRVGTDCAGLEAPILSLQAMQVFHTHVFSCERDPKKREFIKLNFPEPILLNDMCRRSHADLPRHDLYICGFPCKPFSSLHRDSAFFQQAEARPFFAMIRTLRACLPAVAVLENVLGIKRVLCKVWRALRSLRWYEVLTVVIDPSTHGEPVSRPRVFFLLVRVDVAVARGSALDQLAMRLLRVGQTTTRAGLSQRMLPSSSSVVQQWLAKQRSPQGTLAATQGVVGLTPRMQNVLGAALGRGTLRAGINVDVNLSVGWASPRPICPVVTPGCRIVVGELKRLMVPMEKCLVHLVPVHRLAWPAGLSDANISDFGGNTMHLLAVGAFHIIAMWLL